MQSANLFGPLKGLCPHKALIGLTQATGSAGGFDSVAHCCVDWIWRDNISPDLTWVILSAITLAVCLADMSASPLRSYPA